MPSLMISRNRDASARDGKVRRGDAVSISAPMGASDESDTSASFLLHLWQPRPHIQNELCQQLPRGNFVTMYFPKHTGIPSLINLNKTPKALSNNVFVIIDKNADSADGGERNCRHRMAVLRMLQGASRTFWSTCTIGTDNDQQHEDTTDELRDVFTFLLELYASTKARHVVGGGRSNSAKSLGRFGLNSRVWWN